MPEKISYVNVKQPKSILDKYVVEKYGSMNNFLSKLEKINDKICQRDKIENIMNKPDFLEKMELGMKLCDRLRIDFAELFENESIRVLEPDKNLSRDKSAEEQYSLLSLAARRQILDYINDILNS